MPSAAVIDWALNGWGVSHKAGSGVVTRRPPRGPQHRRRVLAYRLTIIGTARILCTEPGQITSFSRVAAPAVIDFVCRAGNIQQVTATGGFDLAAEGWPTVHDPDLWLVLDDLELS